METETGLELFQAGTVITRFNCFQAGRQPEHYGGRSLALRPLCGSEGSE
jgi:hypothetical protein